MKTLTISLAALVVCVAGVYGLYLWPEPAPREGGRELLKAVQRAERRHEQALFLLGRSGWKLREDGKWDWLRKDPFGQPGVKEILSTDVKLRGAGELDEEVVKVLAAAEADLRKGLEDPKNARADKQTQAMAYGTLGQILALHADYAAANARREWNHASTARGAVYLLAAQMGTQGIRAKYVTRLLAVATSDIEQAKTAAEQSEKDLQDKLTTLGDNVQTLEAKQKQIQDKVAKLAADAEKLDIDSQLAPKAKDGLAKFDQSQELKKQVAAGNLELDKIESQIAVLKGQRTDLEVRLKAVKEWIRPAKEQVDAAKGDPAKRVDPNTLTTLLASRQALRTAQEGELTKAVADLDATLAAIEKNAETIHGAVEQAEKDAAAAIGLYEKAAESLAKAVAAQPSERQFEAKATQAYLLMTQAQLRVEVLDNQQENASLLAGLAKDWVDSKNLTAQGQVPLPPKVKVIGQSSVTAPGEVLTKAQTLYTQAVVLLMDAAGRVPNQLKWAYQGQLARALVRKYKMSVRMGAPDVQARADAEKYLKMALDSGKGSPLLAGLREEQNSLPPLP